jgi:hypothetical protein
VDTYGEFRDANEALLQSLPAPRIARYYYGGSDMFLFDEFQTQARYALSLQSAAEPGPGLACCASQELLLLLCQLD